MTYSRDAHDGSAAGAPADADEHDLSNDPTDAGADADLDPRASPEAPAPPTGNVRVDEAVGRLAELGSIPTAEHADVYEDVHRRLHSALTDLDSD